jgi:hypothetical protein
MTFGKFIYFHKGRILHHQCSSWGELGVVAPAAFGSFPLYIKKI